MFAVLPKQLLWRLWWNCGIISSSLRKKTLIWKKVLQKRTLGYYWVKVPFESHLFSNWLHLLYLSKTSHPTLRNRFFNNKCNFYLTYSVEAHSLAFNSLWQKTLWSRHFWIFLKTIWLVYVFLQFCCAIHSFSSGRDIIER